MGKVLVVDDARGVHEMLRTLFDTMKIEAEFAYSAMEALDLFKKSPFDVVLTDVRMDKIDGITLTRKIRRFDPDSVVIVMTAFDRKDDILEALKLGAFDFFIKPFLVNEFTESLKRALAERERRRAARLAVRPAGREKSEELEALRVRLEARESALDERESALAKAEAEWAAMMENGESGTVSAKVDADGKLKELAEREKRLAKEQAAFAKAQAEFEERMMSFEAVGAGLAVSPRNFDEREEEMAEREALLAEREAFLEQSENALFEKGQRLQELETELEQRRENLAAEEGAAGFGQVTSEELAEVRRIKEDVEKRALELADWEARLKRREKTLAKNEALVRAREQYLEASQNIIFEKEDV